MKKLVFLTAIAIVALFVSCDNDDHATDGRSPEFASLELSPSVAHVGDSIVATVTYKYPGKKIYKSDYKLSLSGFTSSGNYNVSYTWTEIDPTKSNPTYKFAAPDEPGTYQVTFSATRINYSSGGPNGELYGSANSVTTNLTVR